MNGFRHREIAGAIIIDTLGRFLLQQRDNVVGIVHPGKVGLFGGHREGDEQTYLECVVREVREELTFQIPAERFEHLASWESPDLDVDGGTLCADFLLRVTFQPMLYSLPRVRCSQLRCSTLQPSSIISRHPPDLRSQPSTGGNTLNVRSNKLAHWKHFCLVQVIEPNTGSTT